MNSYEDSVKAIKLYIQYDCSFSSVKHELGYPENRKTLCAWYQEFNKDGDLHERYTRAQKFTHEQRTEAEEHPEDFQHCSADKARVYLTQEQKVEAVQDLCTRTGSARSVADKYGVSPCSLYIWKKQFFSEGIPTQMPKDNNQNEQKSEAEQISELTSELASLSAEAEDLRKQIYYLQMEKAGLTRSMSKKGCSPDNSACEGLFGRLKNEAFYNHSWAGVSIKEFIEILDQYIHWYAEKRIKVSLGGVSPVE